MEGMAADGMDSSFMAIFGEFMEGYTKCAIKAGTTPEQFQSSIGTLIKARTEVCFIGVVTYHLLHIVESLALVSRAGGFASWRRSGQES